MLQHQVHLEPSVVTVISSNESFYLTLMQKDAAE
tara:strand:- start:1132 stop:1233 length:102 start_codon:yes stop_codon:yes gene_type:complete